ncbi:MAG: oligosaccharide flippase family protein [Actinomycetota bacterium]
MSSVKQLAIRGAVWTIGSYGISQVLRLGSNLILTHLLFPEVFGLLNLVYVFITGLHLFSDMGIGQSIIQNKRGSEPTFLNTAWTMQVLRGVFLWGCCLLLAWPVAKLYGEPRLAWLLPIVGLNTIISGFNSTVLYTLNRDMALGQLALFELGGQVISMTVMIAWAWFHPSIWALIVGGLVATVIQLAWSHWLACSTPNRFAWEPLAVKELISFGKWIFLSTAVTFLAGQTDRLILGWFSFQILGVYGIAYTLSDMPRQIILALASKVIFPAFAKFSELPRETFRAKIEKNRLPILLALAFSLMLLVCFGDMVVRILYDKRYLDGTWMLPILALGVWPMILTQTIDPALFALGKPQYITWGCFFSFLFLAFGIPLGFSVAGSVGAVIAIPLSNLPPYAVITYGLWREKLACIKQDLAATVIFLALIVMAGFARAAAGFGFPLENLLR